MSDREKYTNIEIDTKEMSEAKQLLLLAMLNEGRLRERDDIIRLLEPLGKCEPEICRKGCRGQYRCVGWAYRHAIRLINGEDK
jgi:hypothetical protein